MFVLTREQAYSLAWSGPIRTIAGEIDISDVALAKELRRAGIPLPAPGYWNKVAAGKRVRRIPLSLADLATHLKVRLGGNLTGAVRRRFEGEPGEDDPRPEEVDTLTERLAARLGSPRVPRDFTRAAPAVARYLARDERLRQKNAEMNRTLPRFGDWYRPLFDSPAEKRRLRFLNGLALAFLQLGGRVSTMGEQLAGIDLWLGSGPIRADLTYDRRNEHKLILAASPVESFGAETAIWTDDDSGDLEARLREIILGLGRLGYLRHCVWQAEQQERQRQERARLQGEARAREEQARIAVQKKLTKQRKQAIKSLVRSARGAHKSELIRTFVQRTRERLAATADSQKLDAWCRWALTLADSIDPFLSDRLLDCVEQHDPLFSDQT